MNLIPVIDLMHGQVVRAERGERASYRPIVSALCKGSEPVAVAQTLVAHCAARQLYVADLDALQGGATQIAALRAVMRALPDVELWLDAAVADADAAATLRAQLGEDATRVVTVFGSESLRSQRDLQNCVAANPNAVLSLDRRNGQRLDAAGCWDLPMLWPARVIVMTLERVGADAGPDLDTLRGVQARAPTTSLFGAGGVRNAADLDRAREVGAAGWLVASALHDKRLPPR